MRQALLSLVLGFVLLLPAFADPAISGMSVHDAADPGPVTYTEWVDGIEKEIVPMAGQPLHYLWSSKMQIDNRPLMYADSKIPGVRFLRIGFKNPVTIGSILVRGGGQVSFLRPDATGPGNLNDSAQWIPAQRLEGGKVTDGEVGPDDMAAWSLPNAISTRAIRFTHTAQPSDRNYAGSLGGVAIFSGRWANMAPQAIAIASAGEKLSTRLNDEKARSGAGWENIAMKDGDRARTITADPEWAMLVWGQPVTLQSVALLGNEWGEVEIQAYAGPATEHPREATDSEWKTLRTLSHGKPLQSEFDLCLAAFDSPVTTRALRVRFTKAFDEIGAQGHSRGGKRVSLGEWMAFAPLGEAGLSTAILPAAEQQAHGPIPIRFELPEAGEVTLVIDDASGKRVRNLVSQTPFPKGNNVVWWDGTDDLGRDQEAISHGIYAIPPELVSPGAYTVRGLWHKPLDLRYEMAVYAPGDPPWPCDDGSGGWMTNHTPAWCALFVPPGKAPGGQPLVYLGAPISEGGSAFSWVNLEGKKVGGRGWIGGAWTGAQCLAGDDGPNALADVYAYVGSTYVGNKAFGVSGKVEIRLTMLTTKGEQPVLKPYYLSDTLANSSFSLNATLLGGLAVHDGLLVFSQTPLNQIVFVDVRQNKVLATAPLGSPRGLAFDGQGRLLALTGSSLQRFTLSGATAALPVPETLVSNLEDPQCIALDTAGKIYISDQGGSHQVKVFSPSGAPLGTFGKPGAPKAGLYDPLHMNNPKGLTVDSNGRVWVTENNFYPKRVSVWNPDGTLWKAFYGGPKYGGGGIIDFKDKTRFMYDGMEFRLDWEKGGYQLTRVYYRAGADVLKLGTGDAPPESPLYFNGRRYLSDAYNSSPTSGASPVFLFLDNGDTARPVAAAGAALLWDILKTEPFKSRWPAGIDPNGNPWKNSAFFIWSDLNGDGQVQPDEVTMIPGDGGCITLADDGSFLAASSGTSKGTLCAVRYKPTRFTDQGVPVYDMAAGEILAASQHPTSDGGGQILTGSDGWLVMTTAPPPFSRAGIGGAKNGVPAWSYPSLWPGLHPSHSAPVPDHPGMLVGTTRLLGGLVTPAGSNVGPLFFLNSNQGDIYAFTQDGLFVAQCFQDVRQGQLWKMPLAERNMSLNNISLHDENFFPSVSQSPDGAVYIMSGMNMGVVRVDHLDTLTRIPPTTLQISSDDLERAHDFVIAAEAERQKAQGSGVLSVALNATAHVIDGKSDDWADAQWAQIDHRGVNAYFDSHSKPYDVSAAVAVADGKLLATWKTGDPKLIENAGDVPNGLFKTGGALDLMIGTDPGAKPDRAGAAPGDERLLISLVSGTTRALLYRPVVPGTPERNKVPFTAPWHGITIDRVDDVSTQVQLASDGLGGYEIAVPLSVLNLQPQPGMRIKADIGILRGDGQQTKQRVYWANKATAIVSDVPTEAELTPRLWGTWEFGQK